jgi:DNA-binding transcriptional MocR family regulator
MPGVQNPTSVHMPAARREALAELILRHDLLLLEDDAFGHTGVQQLAAVSALAPENSILICGLSKILYAGLRSAYVVATGRYRRLLSRAILNTIWMTPTLNAAIIAECITSGAVERMMAHKLREAVRRNLLAAQKLAGCSYRGLPAGYFVWLQLPQPWTGPDFEAACRESGVTLFNAEKFAVGGVAAPAAVRLSLTGPGTLAELEKGLDLIVKLLQEDYQPCHPIM